MVRAPCEPWEILAGSTCISSIDCTVGMNFPPRGSPSTTKSRLLGPAKIEAGTSGSAPALQCDESGAAAGSHDNHDIGKIFALKQAEPYTCAPRPLPTRMSRRRITDVDPHAR
jgi:hypothetical protein